MSDEALHFKKAVIIGIGLIGSSVALAMRARGLVAELVGHDLSSEVMDKAVEIGVVDRGEADLKAAVRDSDLIVLSTPVGVAPDMLHQLSALVPPDCLIIDVGSVKGHIAGAAQSLSGNGHFVPCHPVAGTEQSGPEAGFASLFEGRWCIVTPLPDRQQDTAYSKAVEHAVALWQAIGADVELMDAAHHDLALAVTSHLPHLIAFTLVGAADDLESVKEAEIVKYSAGGFRDFTRIAASDPVMWRDVFLTNKDAVLEVLARFSEELALLQRAIRWEDAEALQKAFTRGRALRRAIIEAGQETSTPNFGRDAKSGKSSQ